MPFSGFCAAASFFSSAYEYSAGTEIRFTDHGLAHLADLGLEPTQPEVEAYIEHLVREILSERKFNPGEEFEITFLMDQLGNVPWIARVFIVPSALVSVGTYFPAP